MELPGYEILAPVAYGPCHIYRARQLSLDRIVVIRTHFDVPGSAECLRWVADVLSRLQHPHVVSIIDRFEYMGRLYLVLEYIEGGTLADRLLEKQPPARDAASLIEYLARTLAYIHRCGIIHLDLKPSHVLLAVPPSSDASSRDVDPICEEYGIPVLSGFSVSINSQRLAEVEEGQIRGTPAYMAPEQAQARYQDIGPATDIHGLGVILYEMLTGRPPFEGRDINELLKQVSEKKPESVRKLNPGIDRKLEAICHRCLRKDPAQRYADGLELARELRSYLEGFPH